MRAQATDVQTIGDVAHGALNPACVHQHQRPVGTQAVVRDLRGQVEVRQLVRTEDADRLGGREREHLFGVLVEGEGDVMGVLTSSQDALKILALVPLYNTTAGAHMTALSSSMFSLSMP